MEHNTDQQHQESKARVDFTLFIVQIFQVTKDTSTELSSNLQAILHYINLISCQNTHSGTANLSRLIQRFIMLKRARLSFHLEDPSLLTIFLHSALNTINKYIYITININRAFEHLLNMLLNEQLGGTGYQIMDFYQSINFIIILHSTYSVAPIKLNKTGIRDISYSSQQTFRIYFT